MCKRWLLTWLVLPGAVAACGPKPVAPGSTPATDEDAPEAGVAFPEDGQADEEPAPAVEAKPADGADTGSVEAADPVEDTSAETEPTPDATPEDAEPPPDIPKGDLTCVPNCSGKACGSDGCGGICGYCPYPKLCDPKGTCVIVCEPSCETGAIPKTCGPDGCGGSCQPGCPAESSFECGDDGLCYEGACEPYCGPKECGSDGCGGECGTCAPPNVCSEDGFCEIGPCGTVTAQGECQGSFAAVCKDTKELVVTDCAQFPGHTCKWNGAAGQYMCLEPGPCAPHCDGKACGGDGCGSLCGVCAGGWSCAQGQCKPESGAECGAITTLGVCDGDVLWWCSKTGVLYSLDCDATGFDETCGWDMEESKFDCVAK
jgi:hypothetical protein